MAAPRWLLRNANQPGDPNSAPRCGAKTRSGTPCRGPAMRGKKRCKLHGGKSTGPRTPEGLARSKTSRLRHGFYSREAVEARRQKRAMRRKAQAWADATLKAFFRSGRILGREINRVTRTKSGRAALARNDPRVLARLWAAAALEPKVDIEDVIAAAFGRVPTSRLSH
jgi:hypothetical protein